MPRLVWDQVGERGFEAGVDRGVLFTPTFSLGPEMIYLGVPWNGLIGVDESSDAEVVGKYLDGVKYLNTKLPGDFAGTLSAFTYPKEFERHTGFGPVTDGVLLDNQPSFPFHLSYRTRLGNDVDGIDLGYKIHILWNLVAVPNARSYSSVGAELEPTEFSWELSAAPSVVAGYRPTAHLVLDSTELDPEVLAYIESILYGSSGGSVSNLPSMQQIVDYATTYTPATIIVYNGDGTWTISTADSNITQLSATEFEIDGLDVTYIDPDTWAIDEIYGV